MNQEELDALIKEQLEKENLGDDSEILDISLDSTKENKEIAENTQIEEAVKEENKKSNDTKHNITDANAFLNTPVEKQHKVIFQLDEVARDSELRANEVFEDLEGIQDSAFALNDGLKQIYQYITSQKVIFEKLVAKFPNVKIFQDSLEDTCMNLKLIDTLKDNLTNCDNHINNAINAMQFQDIHQQKLNRVIHIIQSLVHYMNSLFESNKEYKESRAQPARTLVGDDSPDAFSQEEIEELINSFGKKQ
ncbi:hypothetical protein [Helicobacter anatolicus]|uniref:hypothetical protein n=1 Tax=Helicobacter anatolicus TaxID=2905874 RepID=UPI001E2D1A50|nr:hypothetical protein [Helicobacter anatolicus]MCE3040514.1 hypothetical protein [Helicobacter anatolicus]